ncbi:hypothetical protein B9T25_02180 [Acinetobacter sp. ANC 4470]|uniref:hypothetical protein n=1 Tax=Acinetobacter sp. ANC 4470 TaxID=1977881 RepID=UPI000A350EE1|nr:hypothetical protein [Acinetobacter sp. ANC 4470]OTG69410.1 hypothetical protein B9T25_02180 [Acinetobacter sp. ANC 4470]
MKNISAVLLSTLFLTACGGGGSGDSSGVVEQSATKTFYSYEVQADVDVTHLNQKKYHIDQMNHLSIHYSEKPLYQTEAIRNFLIEDAISTISPPQKADGSYWIGENSSFNDTTLAYQPSNLASSHPLKFTYQLKKIGLSGFYMTDYVKYLLRQAKSTPNVSDATLQHLHRLIDSGNTATFKSDAVCWQKLAVLSNQDYMDFNPNSLSHYSGTVVNQGVWNNIPWKQYEPFIADPTKYATFSYENRDYGAIYHTQNETLVMTADGSLQCDFLNESALNSINKTFDL